jgi:hypothetical protein
MSEALDVSDELWNDVDSDSITLWFELLGNDRRRLVIEVLEGYDGPVDLAVLAEIVAAEECAVPLDAVSEDERHRVHVSLYHHHVPRLAEAGFVERDEERGAVEPTDRLRKAQQFVERLG